MTAFFVVGTDIYDRGGHFAQLKGLGESFGHDRVRDAPISEAAMVAAGVGAALNGCHPVVDLNFMDFAYGAMDEIINQAAKIRYMWGAPMPLVIRGTNGVAGAGAQQQQLAAALAQPAAGRRRQEQRVVGQLVGGVPLSRHADQVRRNEGDPTDRKSVV